MTATQKIENAGWAELKRQQELIHSNDVIVQLLDGLNIFVMILNKNREIIFINKEFCEVLCITSKDILGLRPGELLNCKYSSMTEQGCGHSKECALCVAKRLIVQTIQSGKTSEEQVSFSSIINGLEMTSTFQEKVTCIKINEEDFYMVAYIDKSSEVERNNLEHIFFHDILNSAASLYNIIRFLKLNDEKYENDQEMEMIEGYIQNIIDDIEYHRNISSAEHNNLNVFFDDVEINDLVSQVAMMLHKDERFHHITVECQSELDQLSTKTDRLILKRIFTNLLKNAMEANENHSIIRIRVVSIQDQVQIIFHNDEVIPLKHQREIFIKGYSSKSKGRGLGVYGSKLLLMKYLHGNLSFTSRDKSGTDFIVTIPKEVSENC